MSNKQKLSNRAKRKPFEYTKKFRKAISNIDKRLKPGVLVKTRHFGVVLIYIRHSIAKKVWHRKYFFLAQENY